MRLLAAATVLMAGTTFAETNAVPAAPSETVTVITAGKDARRARPRREIRKEGNIPGLVVFDFGKTAGGVPTHLYRIMGQGGAVLDLTDYGAQAVRAYVPGVAGKLTETLGGPDSVLDYEKAGKLAEVWQMQPIRRPQATGCAFVRTDLDGSQQKVTHLLDARNRWLTITDLGGTNAPQKVERWLK